MTHADTPDASDIVVVGGGFAGLWAAVAAARVFRDADNDAGAGDARTVTLIAPGEDLVIRPRLYEADPHTMRVPLDRVLAPIGVRRVAATVTGITTAAAPESAPRSGLGSAPGTPGGYVTAVAADGTRTRIAYGRLVLATGSRLVRPGPGDLPGAEHLHDVDTIESATALDTHLRALPTADTTTNPETNPETTPPTNADTALDHAAFPDGRFTAVVVGSGLTGLEVATELVERLRAIAAPYGARGAVRVVLVERADTLAPELGSGPRPVIADALALVGVETRLGATLTGLTDRQARLSDGTFVDARTVVWTAGVRANNLTACLPAATDALGRLPVDAFLRVEGVPGVYAAGDTAAAYAEPGRPVVQSCQHAIPLGKFAGHNAAAALLCAEPAAFAPSPYVTCLDLGGAGAVFTTGWERAVRMTGDEAKALKRTITGQWIYPPVDDAEEILRHADPAYANGGADRSRMEVA